MIILSFHNSFEASAAIYINEEIKAAVSKERFNRIKNFHGFPHRSIDYLLKKKKFTLLKGDAASTLIELFKIINRFNNIINLIRFKHRVYR